MPKTPKTPVPNSILPGTGSLSFDAALKGAAPVAPAEGLPKAGAEARKPDPHWGGKQGRGFAPVQKPLRLPGKGRGG